jgi:hypothetical protein
VRLSRFIALVLVAVTALAAAAAASALRAPAQDGTLSIRDARATIVIRVRGSIIGRMARGQLTVTEPIVEDGTVVVRGAERERPVNERTTIYRGTNIRFRVASERRFVVRLEGKGINLSAVGRGDVTLDGWGDPEEGVFFDGSYSLNGEDDRSLPDERTRLELAAPLASE